jgi:hypothetical protein
LTKKFKIIGDTQITQGRYQTGERTSQETCASSATPRSIVEETESTSQEELQESSNSSATNNTGKELEEREYLAPATSLPTQQRSRSPAGIFSPAQHQTPTKGEEMEQLGDNKHSGKSPQATSTPRCSVSPQKSQSLPEGSELHTKGLAKSLSPLDQGPHSKRGDLEEEISMPPQNLDMSGIELGNTLSSQECPESQRDMFNISSGTTDGIGLNPTAQSAKDLVDLVKYAQDALDKIALLSKGTCKTTVDSVLTGNKQLTDVALYIPDEERENIVLEKTPDHQLITSVQNLKTLKSLEMRLAEMHKEAKRNHHMVKAGLPVTLDLGNDRCVRGVLLGKAWSIKPKPCVYLLDYQKVVYLDSAQKLRVLTEEYGKSFLSTEAACYKIPLSTIGEPENHQMIWLKWEKLFFPPGASVRCLMSSLPVTPNAGSTLVMHGRSLDKDIGDGFKWQQKQEKEIHRDEDETKIHWTLYKCSARGCPAELDMQCKF